MRLGDYIDDHCSRCKRGTDHEVVSNQFRFGALANCKASNRIMGRYYFPPGEEPRVLTSISDECQVGECENCPCIFERDEYPGQSIFCVHDCHTALSTLTARSLTA